MADTRKSWPPLRYAQWRETCENLQLRTQVVGKVRLALTPWLNHSWHVTLYLTARGLTTGRPLQIDFDFIDHRLLIQGSDGSARSLLLVDQPIADFYTSVLAALADIGVRARVHHTPNEVENPIPFVDDRVHHAYDREAVQRFWCAMLEIERVFDRFRTSFLGKASPIHFFWGSFDLAVTRFSGRACKPPTSSRPGLPDAVSREAYSHEVSSAGFWPGGSGVDYAAFYSYAYPEPDGFSRTRVQPEDARYDESLGMFLLPYDSVRNAQSPDDTLLAFLRSTYEAAATNGNWDRTLECAIGVPGVPRRVD
jgi:hypothetical protein